MCPNIDKHIAFASRCEDPKILKQDGKLDEEDDKAVDNGCEIDPLSLLSVSAHSSSIHFWPHLT